MYEQSPEKRKAIVEFKEVVVNRSTAPSESELLTVFNYPNIDIFRKHFNEWQMSYADLANKFPEMKSLGEANLKLVLSQSLDKYKLAFTKLNHKSDSRSGRTQTCDDALSTCFDNVLNNMFWDSFSCLTIGIGGMLGGIALANPGVIGLGLAAGVACGTYADLAAAKSFMICSDNRATCGSTSNMVFFNSGLDHVNLHDLNYYFNSTYWPAVPAPVPALYYVDSSGHIYYY